MLQSTSGVTGTVALAGTANNVASLGSFAVTGGDFSLVDNGNTGNLSVTGPVTATNIAISDANTGTIAVSGSIGATTGLTLASGSGGIQLNTGEILSGATVDLSATGGGVMQVATGTLNASTLTSTGDIVGAAVFAGTANQIGTISGMTAGGTLTVVDNRSLVLAGKVSASNTGTVDIETTSAGTLTQASTGTLIAGTLTSTGGIAGAVVLNGTANQIGTIVGVTSGGTLTVVDSNALTLAGVVGVGGAGTIDITTLAGGLTQAASGTLIAGTLTSAGNIAGLASLNGIANQIGTISNMTASGGLTVVDNMALTLANTVSGSTGTVGITTLTGGVTQATSGVLIAGTLTSAGGIAGATSLLGTANQIASIDTIAVGSGNLTLNDSINLAINANGTLSAHQITVTDVGKAIAVATGVQILTDGVARPLGSILPSNLPTSTGNSNGGAYFSAASFIQSGVLNANNLNGTANILRIDTSAATQLDPSGGVNGPNTWLILGLTDGAVATGALNAKALDITFSGALGSASLSGSINNLTGQGAAGAAYIEPSANANYKMNACAVSSVNCVLLPSQGIPQHNPTSEIVFAVPYIPSVDDNQDIVVPLVTDSNDTITVGNDDDDSADDRKRKRSRK